MRSILLDRLAVVLLAACPAFSPSLAGEEGAPPPAGDKQEGDAKPAEKKGAGKKAGGKKAAGKAEGAAVDEKDPTSIPLTVKQLTTWEKRMRQTYQAGNFTNLKIILGNVLPNEKRLSETKLGRECFGIACFYKSGFVAQERKLDEALNWINKAIDNEFLSASAFESLTELEPLKADPRFVARMKKLRDELDQLMRKEFEKEVTDGIAKPGERLVLPAAPGALPAGQLMGFQQFTDGALAGRLACVIVTPIHHDGFTKEAPSLERLAEMYKDKIDVCVLFYQVDSKDDSRKELTQKYINMTLGLKTKTPLKGAIVGRDYVKPLEIPFFPAHYFLNADGRVIYARNGFLEENKLEFIFGEQARITPPPAPPAPKAEAPPAPKTEPPPAPPAPKAEEKKPEEKKPETTPPPPPESPPEEKKL